MFTSLFWHRVGLLLASSVGEDSSPTSGQVHQIIDSLPLAAKDCAAHPGGRQICHLSERRAQVVSLVRRLDPGHAAAAARVAVAGSVRTAWARVAVAAVIHATTGLHNMCLSKGFTK